MTLRSTRPARFRAALVRAALLSATVLPAAVLPAAVIPAAVLSAALLTSGVALAGERLTLDKCPAAVRATVVRETHGGKVESIETDHHEGVLVYEVEFRLGGKKYGLEIAGDGKLLDRHPD